MSKYEPELNEKCEVLHLESWHKGTIKAKTGQWYIVDTFAGEIPFQIEQSSFRPLKSDEELAIEQIVEGVAYGSFIMTKTIAKELYKKGCRKVGAKVELAGNDMFTGMPLDELTRVLNENFDVYEKVK